MTDNSIKAKLSPISIQPPRITRINADEYREIYWPYISKTLAQILSLPNLTTNLTPSFSREELYRIIYKICQKHSNQLFDNLVGFVEDRLNHILEYLESIPDNGFISTLNRTFVHYTKSVEIISDLFHHLERFLEETLLAPLLNKLFEYQLLESPSIKSRLAFLFQSQNTHLSICDPAVLRNLISGLYSINPELSELNPQLFALYIPCLRPARVLEEEVQETLQYLAQLRGQGFSRGSGYNKRKHQLPLPTPDNNQCIFLNMCD
eukprot:TRINITY_DN16207_c0_g1_i1.p1 TRINITY_DN16207_c0_g1~~TRINITY_DN16207_c0_g1_i1.p1  ORF type:complete len:264 (-),score=17.82 TRINITY_DN16207_c0_g1_i1:167-958(-)